MKQQPLCSTLSAACLLALMLCFPALAQAATLNVPSQYATIQAAVNAAQSGDTVLIADGTYTGPGNVDIDFNGKNLTVTSIDGAARTIINCQGTSNVNHRGFYLHSGETNATISGLTVENGYSGNSGSYGVGGGILADEAGLTVINCSLNNNTASNGDGGGLWSYGLNNVTVSVIHCTFTGNTSSNSGGGIYNGSTEMTVQNCTLSNNVSGSGAGISLGANQSTITSCTFDANTASSGGGGLAIGNGSGLIVVVNCAFKSNTAPYGGGISSFSQTSGTIAVTDCALIGNTASQSGAGIYNSSEGSGPITLTNCTFTGNAVSSNSGVPSGGGIYNYPESGGGSMTLTNDILYGDTGGEVTNNAQSTSLASATHCDIQGGYAGTGNINVDPLFANSPTDLHLGTGSPCLGAGTASGAPTTTIDGVTRPNPPSIGAYEGVPMAVATLASSLNPSVSGRSVTFTASVSPPPGAFGPTGTVTFTVDGTAQAPVTLGHYGTSTGMAFYTTSSLTIGSHTLLASYSGDGSYGASMSAVLTEVVNAHVNPQYVSPSGNDSNPGTQAAPKLTIQAALNSVLSGDAVLIGPGTYTGPGNVDLSLGGQNILVLGLNGPTNTIIDCQGSSSANHRGFSLGSETNTVIAGLTIENGYDNTGGGILNFSTGLNIQNCILKNNTATDGGGLYSDMPDNGTAQLTNCVIEGNTASEYFGGGVDTIDGIFTMTNCTVINNTAVGGLGGGICVSNDGNSAATLTNDIFFGDTGGELSNGSSNSLPGVTSYCDIQGGYAGTGNINVDPLFANSPTDLHLGTGSPCLGAGTASGAPTTTIDGVTRPNPPSIGAYEGVPVATTVSAANVSGTAGQSVTLSATLTATSGGGLSGKTLSFTVDGVATGPAVTNSAGTASLTYGIQAGANTGSHTISVSFAGDSVGNASSGTGTLTVSAPVPVGQVRFSPRAGYSSRMAGGLFQGSSDNAHWTTLAAVTQMPPVNAYSTLPTSADPATFRYLRYLAPNGSYGNVAEIEFDSHGVKLAGTGFGTAGSYNNSGNTFAKALDGSTSTYFDAPAPGNSDYVGIDRGTLTYTKLTGTAFGTTGSYKNDGNTFLNVFDGNSSTFFDAPAPGNGDYAGLDLGAGHAAIVTRIGYCPRSGYAFRMVGGVFQGSNDNAAWTVLYTVTSTPATGILTQTTAISSGTAYRYLRYLAPNGSYGNAAEVEFDTSP